MTLLHYTLERLVGTGGMSSVWAASDRRTGRLVALKLLRASDVHSRALRIRLLREAYATRTVVHPAILPVLDVFEHEGSPVLVMELLEGETLRQRLNREQKLPLGLVAELLLPVAEALDRAHAVGIAHRDVKPENIFLPRGSSEADAAPSRLLDFGVARFREVPPDGEPSPITGLDMLLGTVAYMAPEQALRPSECDHRVDIWACGVVLYEALSGCRPIEGTTGPDTMRQLLIGGVTPIQVLLPELPEDVVTLVSTMLVRKPELRASSLSTAVETLGRHVTTRERSVH